MRRYCTPTWRRILYYNEDLQPYLLNVALQFATNDRPIQSILMNVSGLSGHFVCDGLINSEDVELASRATWQAGGEWRKSVRMWIPSHDG